MVRLEGLLALKQKNIKFDGYYERGLHHVYRTTLFLLKSGIVAFEYELPKFAFVSQFWRQPNYRAKTNKNNNILVKVILQKSWVNMPLKKSVFLFAYQT